MTNPRTIRRRGTGLAAFAAVVTLAAAALTAAPAAAQQAPKAIRIAVANPARIFNEMQETKSLQAQVAEDQKKFVAAQKEKRAAIEQLRSQRDGLKPDAPQYEELNDQLLNASLQAKAWEETEKAKHDRKHKKQMKALFEKIQNAVGEVAKADGIDLVIADQTNPLPEDIDQLNMQQLQGYILQKDVLFASKESDISDKVLALLDAKFRGAATGGANK